MKKLILEAFCVLALAGGLSSCGKDFLNTKAYDGIDVETGLNSVHNIQIALNGTYYQLCAYYFAGNYAISMGDIPTDLSYWNTQTGHWDEIYQYAVLPTDLYLEGIWVYGYKVADNAARVIDAANALYDSSSDEEKTQLDQCLAEAYALRGYAQLILTNVFGHQVKVNGTDFSSEQGIVIIDHPKQALTDVSRSTIGESYAAVLSDFEASLTHFTAAGGDRGSLFYFNEAAVNGLLARTNLYLENWSDAKTYAQAALDDSGITTLAYTVDDYKALYSESDANTESMFALAIDATMSWSANSSGTLWSTYNFSPSPKLLALYGPNDCRQCILSFDAINSTETMPVSNGGKYSLITSGNPAEETNCLVNAPEMYLILAEANLRSGDIAGAQTALLTVAKRNADITSTADLPSDETGLMSFIKDERARELFQEGLRLYDLRRWDENASVYAYNAPNVAFTFNNYKISNLVYPIPQSEIDAGFGVTQNDGWNATMPKN